MKHQQRSQMETDWVTQFKAAIQELEMAPLEEGLDPAMRALQLEALRSILSDLESELDTDAPGDQSDAQNDPRRQQ